MNVEPSLVIGETELNVYIRVQQLSKETDPLPSVVSIGTCPMGVPDGL